MKTKIKVIAGSSCDRVIQEDGFLKVKTTTPPSKGKANKKVVELLADYFKVSKSDVDIIKGLTSSNKIVNINIDKK